MKRTDVVGLHAPPAPRDALPLGYIPSPWDVKTGQGGAHP